MTVDTKMRKNITGSMKDMWKSNPKSMFAGFWMCYLRNSLFYLIFPYTSGIKKNKNIE